MPDLSRALAQHIEKHPARDRAVVSGPSGPYMDVDGRRVLSFCGNDYLSLANDPVLIDTLARAAQRFGVSAGGSPLASGYGLAHQRLEQALAEFVGCDAALYFADEYLAHVDVIGALVGKGDAIFADEYAQISLRDGARMAGARVETYSHGDMEHLEFSLASSTAPTRLIVSDTLFSLTGDLAPVRRLVEMSERYDAWLLLNDSHGFGLLGEHGRGIIALLGAHPHNVIYASTLSHAAGVAGAFVAGARDLVAWLLQSLRAYGVAPSAPAALAAAGLASLQRIHAESARRERIRQLVGAFRAALKDSAVRLLPSESHIQVVMAGDSRLAQNMSRELLEGGIWVQTLQPPAVPGGTARLRMALCAGHTLEDVERLALALVKCAANTQAGVAG